MRNTRTITALAAALAFCLLTAIAPSHAVEREGIAAVVNDSIISYSDIRARMKLGMVSSGLPDTEETRNRMQDQVLEVLINESLQMQEAEKLGITVTEEQIDHGFATVAQQNKMGPDDFLQKLRSQGIPVETMERQIRAQLAWQQVVRRKLLPQINVSENDIDSVFDNIERNAGSIEFHVAEIFLAVPDQSQEEEVKARTEQLLQKLVGGETFSSVAREYSQSPGSSRGGDLGWLREGQMAPEIETAVKRMKPGQVSPPIRSSSGYHLVFLRGMRQVPDLAAGQGIPNAGPQSGAAVRLQRIHIPVAADENSALVAAKTARAVKLQETLQGCDTMKSVFPEFDAPGTGDLGMINVSSLPQQVAAVIDSLAIGQASPPIRDPEGISVLMVCERGRSSVAASEQSPSIRDDEEKREQIANKLGLERLDMMQQRYLRDLKATAFIDKRI